MKKSVIIFFVVALGQGVYSFLNYVSEEESDSFEHGVGTGTATTSCPCGWTNKARIVGGKEAQKNEYPLMLAIMSVSEGNAFCGASILTKRHALTAAHCTYGLEDIEDIVVAAGAHDLMQGGDYDKIIGLQEIIEHEDYNNYSFENDIALLILSEPLEFNQFIGPVCMPSQHYSLVNHHIKVIGWGATQTGGSMKSILRKTNLRVVPLEECHEAFKVYLINLREPKQICTLSRGKDSCQGDSGGPLLWMDEATNRLTLVGLVSYGRQCAADIPGVNTDVFAYMDWIKLKIKESNLGLEVCQRI